MAAISLPALLSVLPALLAAAAAPPQLLGAHYKPPVLAVRLTQPSDRAGMLGLASCRRVLTDGSVDLLRGAASEDPRCRWAQPRVHKHVTHERRIATELLG